MIVQELNVNLIPGGVVPTVKVSQYDKGSRVLKLHLYLGDDEYQPPDGTTAYIQGTKLDGKDFLYKCEWEGNTVTSDITGQMTVIPGAVRCEVFLQEETEKRIGTANFAIVVERAPLQDDKRISETEIPLIGTLAEAAVKARLAEIAAEQSASSAAQSKADVDASEQKVAQLDSNVTKNAESARQDAESASKSADAANKSAQAAAASESNAQASEESAKESEAKAENYAELSEQSANKAGWIRTYYNDDDFLCYERSDSLSEDTISLKYDDNDNLMVVMK